MVSSINSALSSDEPARKEEKVGERAEKWDKEKGGRIDESI